MKKKEPKGIPSDS